MGRSLERGSGRILPGFMIPSGSKTCLIPAISGIRSPCSCPRAPILPIPIAVLPGAGAAAGEGVVDDQLDELLRACRRRRIVRVHVDADVEVPVACMPEDASGQLEPLELPAGEVHRRRELGHGDARVGRPLLASGRPGRRRVGGRVASLPQSRAGFGVTFEDDLGRALGARDLLHELEIAVDGLARPARLDEQARRLGQRSCPSTR